MFDGILSWLKWNEDYYNSDSVEDNKKSTCAIVLLIKDIWQFTQNNQNIFFYICRHCNEEFDIKVRIMSKLANKRIGVRYLLNRSRKTSDNRAYYTCVYMVFRDYIDCNSSRNFTLSFKKRPNTYCCASICQSYPSCNGIGLLCTFN